MDDLISRQSAIDAILHNQEVYSNNFGDDPIDKYTIAIIDNDAQMIAQLPSAQRWIPCKERLPEDEEEVIVSVRDDSGDNTLNYSSCGWYACAGDFWVVDNDPNYRVVAWMPLPEPWNGEKRND